MTVQGKRKSQQRSESDAPAADAKCISGPFVRKLAVLENGERFPFLFARGQAVPLLDPTFYATAELRKSGRAYRTIDRHLAAIQFLLTFGWAEGIDIGERIESGEFLTLSELLRLDAAAGRHLDAIVQLHAQRHPSVRVVSLERLRDLQSPDTLQVSEPTAAVRLKFINAYLTWTSEWRLGQLLADEAQHGRYAAQRVAFLEQLDSLVEDYCFRYREREGPPREVIEEALRIAHPSSPDNPWFDSATRERNYVIIRWLIDLGIRVGELLNAYVSDVKIGRQEIHIIRRQDSPLDPRRPQPNVKTDGRALPLMSLGDITEHYFRGARRRTTSGGSHPFLFVTSRSGEPLSVAAVEKVVRQLGQKAKYAGPLTPHLLRHAWNGAFSRHAKGAGMPEHIEMALRSYLMGWKPQSTAAKKYLGRHVREEAAAALSSMNALLMAPRETV
jgi:integrase